MRRSWLPGAGRYRLWWLFAGTVLLTSVVAGVLGAAALPDPVRRDLEASLTLPALPPQPGPELLPASLRRNLLESAGLAWLVGLSPAGLPLIWFLLFWRGFQLGFAAAFLWGWQAGRQRALLLSLLPHNLLALPALCLLVVSLGRVSIALARSLWQGRSVPSARLVGDGSAALGATMLLWGASYVEAYLTPRLVALSLELLP